MIALTWLGIVFCLTQSAMFSGLNLAFFSLGRLHLEAEAEKGCAHALKILLLRTNSNFLLSTILWGNVSVNVALAMLSDSVMTGVVAFLFSTCGITFLGEIIPQAYFSRHALRVGSLLAPVIKLYQIILWPVAKPCALFLDNWIGKEGPMFLTEADFEILLERHLRERLTDIGQAEGRGALNFLKLDDLRISGEGSSVDPTTILDYPELSGSSLVAQVQKTRNKWIIFCDSENRPQTVMNSDEFLRSYFDEKEKTDPREFCHEPIIVTNSDATLDTVLSSLEVESESHDDRLIDREVILYWGENSKRIITGPDLLGRLLRGIATKTTVRKITS